MSFAPRFERAFEISDPDIPSLHTFADESDAMDNPFSKHPKQETEDGTKLVKEFLNTWAARVPAPMEVDDATDEDRPAASTEEEMKVLKEVAEEFRTRLEANPFTKDLLDSF